VQQALRDSLEEAMDLPGLLHQLQKLFSGELKLLAKDTPEPSVLCHEILIPRFTLFSTMRRSRSAVRVLSTPGAPPRCAMRTISRARPGGDPARARGSLAGRQHGDELYDALMVAGYLLDEEITRDGASCWRARPPHGREERAMVRHGAERRFGGRAPGKPHGSSRPIAEKENSILLKLEGQGESSAAASPPERASSNGAIAGCWRAFIATR